MWFFFFFQAEDGIRDLYVTGVQTCALPISLGDAVQAAKKAANDAAKSVASGTSKAKANFAEAKAKLDAMFIAEEQSFHKALDGLPSMKGKTTAQLAADYKKVSSDI